MRRAGACRASLTGPGTGSIAAFSEWGGVAQLVEQWNHNPFVAGSSPAAATKDIKGLAYSSSLVFPIG